MSNLDIKPEELAIVRRILSRHIPQYEVRAFGSRAKGTAKPYSDLDLAVMTGQPLSLAEHAALSDDFSQSDLPWKVDIVDWAATGEAFRNVIARQYIVIQQAV
ncbi:nucleotidyltransferase family protein [Bergeriella denitrificans]|uniref:Predicted nucleotidyltransferases n=1 Tax=Bergeriella denitrificans TaxID=494 RepID=A0A378UI76_BERDE|nr:nucleotidyltransferase domain-containing protein [Bergeriella denitrificans]STZ76201.1 Predicted nucleotidyltransferases [Bergeriella denitrificans]